MSSSFKEVQDEYGIGNGTYNYAQQKQAKTKQKNIVREAAAPAHVLDAAGVEVPGQSFNPENGREYPTTKECVSDSGESVTIHLHQDVREDMTDSFGDFGAVSEDTDDVVWTAVDLTDGTVTLTVVGKWWKRRDVAYSEFAANYEPQYIADETPKFGY